MSDYRAIAGVSGALRQLIYKPASAAVPGASVRTGPPKLDPVAASAGLVNIFPYQVNPDPTHRNAELPTRRSDGSVLRRPQLALDIDYLLSFYGEESNLVPELLMGATMSALHAQPFLKPEDIPNEIGGRSMADSGLQEQLDVLRLSLLPLSHEELHRIWSVFFQVPYTLSVVYRCQVVLIEAELDPEPAMPVLASRVTGLPWAPVEIDRVEPQIVEYGGDERLLISGRGFRGGEVSVAFGDVEVVPRTITPYTLELDLPQGLAAGVKTLRVRRRYPSGPAVDSIPVSLVLRPRVASVPEVRAGAEETEPSRMVLRLEPEVGSGQRIELLVNEWPVPESRRARSYQFKAAGDSNTGAEIAFPLDDIEAGDYLVRVEVDGVASALTVEEDATSPEFGRYNGPRASIP
ncbi:MAG: DUF4255 domain-containing protein [Thermoanaerobaculia bacterium]